MGVLDTIHVDKSSNDEHHPIVPFLCKFGTIDISKFFFATSSKSCIFALDFK